MKRSQQESCDLVRIPEAALWVSWGVLEEFSGHPDNYELERFTLEEP